MSTPQEQMLMQLMQQRALGGMNPNPTGFNPETMAANASMPNPNMGGGFLGGLNRANVGFKNVLGKLGQGLFQIDPAAAQHMSAEQQQGIRNQGMLNMGMGILGAASRPGATLGGSLAEGYFGAQKDMLGQQQMAYQLGAANREERRDEQRYQTQLGRQLRSDDLAERKQDYTETSTDRAFGADREDQGWLRDYRDRSLQQQSALQSRGLDMEAARLELGYKQLEQSGQLGLLRIAASNQKAGKLTEGEQRSVSYASRMRNAENALAQAGYAPQGLSGAANVSASNIPLVGNFLTSGNFQKYQASAREWIAGLLRYDSGAAVPDTEFTRYFNTWFPQPGDRPEVIAQKEQQRQLARQSLEAALPPRGQEMINQTAPMMNGGLGAPAGGATGSWAPTPEGMAAYEKYGPRN